MKTQKSFLIFRLVVAHLAAVIGVLAIWLLFAEAMRPSLGYFPSNATQAQSWASAQSSIRTAASIAVIRGDLWTEAAIAGAAPLLFTPVRSSGTSARTPADDIRSTVERATRLAPHDARNWLVLARLLIRDGAAPAQIADALTLSYYTGSNEPALSPLRLALAVQSDAIQDQDLQGLVELEVQRIALRHAELKPALVLAYRGATAKGREIIEAALVQTDPNFLDQISAAPPSR